MTGEPRFKAMPWNLGEEVCMSMKAAAVCRPAAGAAHTTGRLHLCRGALPPCEVAYSVSLPNTSNYAEAIATAIE